MRKRQSWKLGDIFLVKLKDGTLVVGQVVGQERQVLNSVSCAFFDLRLTSEDDLVTVHELTDDKLIAVLFVTRDLLDNSAWRVVAHGAVTVPEAQLPNESLRASGFVGAKVRGSGIVEKFLNAFYALLPWDDWHNPAYLDDFLISPDKKPANLISKASLDRSG
jgi:hypothetical protein